MESVVTFDDNVVDYKRERIQNNIMENVVDGNVVKGRDITQGE